MATVGESSLAPSILEEEKPVIVRVKRKASLSLVEAFWLEIKERPIKRPLTDFGNLSISDSSGKDELKTKKVLVQHVETLKSTDALVEVVQSFVAADGNDSVDTKTKTEERRSIFKRENKIQEQLLVKARQDQEIVAKNARFEQIWRSRKGDAAGTTDKLHEICHFYDVVRVDAEEKPKEEMSLEDQMMLSSYLPLLRDHIPSAAAEIEADIRSFLSNQASDKAYVYDFYAVKHDMEMTDQHISFPYPLVQVDDEDFYDYSDESECETDDSNAEGHPQNDYPDEISEEEEEESESDDSSNESEEDHETNSDKQSSELEDSQDDDLSADLEQLYEDEMYDDADGDLVGFEFDDASDDNACPGDDDDWHLSHR